MNRILLLLACFFAMGSLTAQTIGHVEYNLPKQAQDWKIANQFQGSENIKSTTIIYVPKDATRKDAKESFGVHVNNLPVDLADEDSLEKGVQANFPDKKVTVNILERDPQSILYEWILNDDGQDKIHGWTRAFSANDETVLLNYQTMKMDEVSTTGPIWLQALKDAKLSRDK